MLVARRGGGQNVISVSLVLRVQFLTKRIQVIRYGLVSEEFVRQLHDLGGHGFVQDRAQPDLVLPGVVFVNNDLVFVLVQLAVPRKKKNKKLNNFFPSRIRARSKPYILLYVFGLPEARVRFAEQAVVQFRMADGQVKHVDQFNRVPAAHVHDQFRGQVQYGRFALSVFHSFVLFLRRPVHVVGFGNARPTATADARERDENCERPSLFAENTRNDDRSGCGWGGGVVSG